MKDISVSFLATALIQAANIATGLLAARLLLPEGRGELAAIMLWPGLIAELGILGLSDSVLYHAATRRASPRALFAAMASLAAGLSVVLIAAGLVILPLVLAAYPPELQRLAVLYLGAFLPTYFGALFLATLFQGQLELVIWNGLRCVVGLGYLGFILVLLAVGAATVGGFALAAILANLAALAAGLALAWREGWVALRPRLEVMKELVVYGAKVHLGEMLNSVRQRLDQAVVALWLPAADLGLYVVALTVANAPSLLGQTIANVAFPKVSQQDSAAGKAEVFGRYLRFALALAATASLALFALADWLVPLLFGRPFAPAAAIVGILILGAVPLAGKLMFMAALKAWNQPLAIGRAEVSGLVAAVVSLAALLPRFGLWGAAWSLVIAQTAATLHMSVSLSRRLDLRLAVLLRPTPDDWRLVIAAAVRLASWPARR
ncbi:MAG: lipopolysaccharide biosynthesis protein [Pseudomonadota bacterium]